MPSFARVVARLRTAGCVYAEDEATLLLAAAGTSGDLETMLRRRVAGEPLEHLLGWVDFCGIKVELAPGVFVPRPRTELLVREAARLARQAPAAGPPTVLDLCCGCGAVGAAIATAVPGTRLYASDVDSASVGCARRNLRRFGAVVCQGDLFAPLPGELRGRVDVLVANVPYVPTGELELLPVEARRHEPREALDGGGDGLDVLRRVAAEASRWLAPAGHLLVETAQRQAATASRVMAAAGLRPRVAGDDDLGATVVIGSAQRDRAAGGPTG